MTDPDVPELDSGGLRHFAFILAMGVALLFGLFFPWLLDSPWPAWPWAFAALFAVWGLLHAQSLRPVYRIWMRLGLLLNRVTTPLVLGIIFYLVLTPVGLVMRITGRDVMTRQFDRDAVSYREPVTKPPKERMERPF